MYDCHGSGDLDVLSARTHPRRGRRVPRLLSIRQVLKKRLGDIRADGADPMYPLNPDIMWQFMDDRREQLLALRRDGSALDRVRARWSHQRAPEPASRGPDGHR